MELAGGNHELQLLQACRGRRGRGRDLAPLRRLADARVVGAVRHRRARCPGLLHRLDDVTCPARSRGSRTSRRPSAGATCCSSTAGCRRTRRPSEFGVGTDDHLYIRSGFFDRPMGRRARSPGSRRRGSRRVVFGHTPASRAARRCSTTGRSLAIDTNAGRNPNLPPDAESPGHAGRAARGRRARRRAPGRASRSRTRRTGSRPRSPGSAGPPRLSLNPGRRLCPGSASSHIGDGASRSTPPGTRPLAPAPRISDVTVGAGLSRWWDRPSRHRRSTDPPRGSGRPGCGRPRGLLRRRGRRDWTTGSSSSRTSTCRSVERRDDVEHRPLTSAIARRASAIPRSCSNMA